MLTDYQCSEFRNVVGGSLIRDLRLPWPSPFMFAFDDSFFPIVHITAAKTLGELDADGLSRGLDERLERAGAARLPLFAIVNALWVDTATPLFRKAFAEWEAALPEDRFSHFGCRIVVSDRLSVRGALTAMSWFSPRGRGVLPAKTFEAGVNALRKELESAGRRLSTVDEAGLRELDAKQTRHLGI